MRGGGEVFLCAEEEEKGLVSPSIQGSGTGSVLLHRPRRIRPRRARPPGPLTRGGGFISPVLVQVDKTGLVRQRGYDVPPDRREPHIIGRVEQGSPSPPGGRHGSRRCTPMGWGSRRSPDLSPALRSSPARGTLLPPLLAGPLPGELIVIACAIHPTHHGFKRTYRDKMIS